jgi:Pyruvate/2-oxoacid:ferredoxin oxidoreductase delta subunit
VTLYFYTGTGNSYRVATWMADAARRAGADVTLRPIGAADPDAEIDEAAGTLLGLVTPTHGFTTPAAMLRFARRLPRRRGVPAVVVATRAGMRVGSRYTPGFEGTAPLLVALILRRKGYRVRGTAGIDMPSNWLAVHPGLDPDAVAGILRRAQGRTTRFGDAILAGEVRFEGWPVALLGVLMLPLSLAYLVAGRLFLSKLLFASNRCTGCGLCAEGCPNGAIEMRGRERRRPYWTLRCESCMRCMAYCPTEAVEANHLWIVMVGLLAGALPVVALLRGLVTHVPALAPLERVPGWTVKSALALGLALVAYPVLHQLLGIRWVNALFTHATPTHYYRRYHEPGTRPRDLV